MTDQDPMEVPPRQAVNAAAADRHIAALEARRELFVARMSAHLAECCNAADLDAAEVADALLHALVAAQGSATIRAPRSHRSVRPCFAAFGDELVPTLRAILGDDLPIVFLARCVDGYWRYVDHVIRHAD